MNKPLLNELTLREKIGQTAVAYCHNEYTNPENKMWGALYINSNMKFKEFNARFDDKADAVKGASYKDWIELMENANKRFKIPIIGVTDNSSGLYSVLPEFTKLTTNLLIGATDDEKLAYKAGYARALQMRCAGIKWWWGPEVDLTAWKEPIQAARQFSDDPNRIIRLAKAMIKGSIDAGVAATAKHFPGEDQIEYRDSHISAIANYLTIEEWEKKQGRIYKELIADDVPAIMVSHIAFPAVDSEKIGENYRPCTISYKVVTEFLKGKLGFKGVVCTDALSMRSVVTALNEDMERVYIEAFKAGNDFMLGCEDYYIDCIEEAVLKGEITLERVNDACQRVLDFKEKVGMFADYKVAEGDFEKVKEYCSVCSKEIADKGINLVCDRKGLLPVKAENIKNVAIIYVCPNKSVRNEYKTIKEEFEKRGAKVTVYEPLTSREMIEEISAANDLIVYIAHYGVNATFVDPEYRSFNYALLVGSEKSVVINTSDHTMYYEFFERFPAFINAFTASKETLISTVEKIYGESDFCGISPFPLYPPDVTKLLKNRKGMS